MREAEKNLDQFWDVVDDHYSRKLGKRLHEYLSAILAPRELERTPEWVEPPKSEETPSPPTISEVLPNFTTEEPTESSESYVPKVKVKTRGAPTTHPELDVVSISVPPSPQPTIAVSKRALKVFSSIFYNPMQDLPPGEIPWTEFLHALSSAGFAFEKQLGSAWLFKPSDTTQRPIIFHEPHPSSKIPIIIARRHGRRLRLAYGWTADTFVLKNNSAT